MFNPLSADVVYTPHVTCSRCGASYRKNR